MVPDMISLKKLFNFNDKQLKQKVSSDQFSSRRKLFHMADENGISGDTVRLAEN